uniref:Oxysterol-binding protein n=1 Tax=Neogobius melanostomus TaxID=47308 RepID=A0A8C6TPK5_9GOBI
MNEENKVSEEADSWEIIEGLKIGQSNVLRPDKYEGFMLKKRKWPLKGWHKRFFVMDNGILKYSKSPLDIQKGKLHGSIDVGLSVMSIKKSSRRIDLDTEEHIYHLKVKSQDIFDAWVSRLRHHRLYRQNEIVRSPREATLRTFPPSTAIESPQSVSTQGYKAKVRSCLARCQSNLTDLSRLLQSLEILQRTQSAPNFIDMQVNYFTIPSKCNKPRVFELNIKLLTMHCVTACGYVSVGWNHSKPTHAVSSVIDQPLFCCKAVRASVFLNLSVPLQKALSRELFLLLQAGEQMGIPLSQQASNESRLSMSESVSEFFDAQEVLLSASSSENEGSDDESYVSDVSDNISEDNAMANGDFAGSAFRNGRRTYLSAPCPDTSNINLWNILRNNIGKDLSKVSMPVELNEPLNTLQRMCEEMEYSELLDKAAETEDPFERMVLVAAFAISGYSSTYYRAGSKPFNPLLGETYECIREDKGFCFFSEQVSHHPPISACHCDSKNFTFWQDVRWKNKFWGKSMEILPIGSVNLTIPRFGDHYEWNKVTTCVHNILSGRRWIEHYGEITIRNTKSSACLCKLTFVKGNYWSSTVNEVQGFVMDQEGKVIHRLFGKWHEGLYCGMPPSAKCVWRPGSMPTDYELYYGFTRFAIELNELCPELKDALPRTDARFRPDQRYLEEGNLEMAASEKQRIEDLQRTRRKRNEENNIKQETRFFKKVLDANHRERWVSNNTYWELRRNPGFINIESTVNLW